MDLRGKARRGLQARENRSMNRRRDANWVKREFQKRLRLQLAVLVFVIAAIAALYIDEFLVPEPFKSWFLTALGVSVLAATWFARQNWRCPVCNQWMGHGLPLREGAKYCPRCGTTLEDSREARMRTIGERDPSITEARDPIWVKEEYKRRRRLLLVPFLSIVALIGASMIGDLFLPAPFRPWLTTVAVLFLMATVLFTIGKWRCPACGEWLGKMWEGRKYCQRCGATLED
jgi:hypothetical protein